VGIANLFFLPLADKIQSISNGFAVLRDLLVEGVVGIAEGENPRTIELRLRGFATTDL
jgi:chemotaxis protein MotA